MNRKHINQSIIRCIGNPIAIFAIFAIPNKSTYLFVYFFSRSIYIECVHHTHREERNFTWIKWSFSIRSIDGHHGTIGCRKINATKYSRWLCVSIGMSCNIFVVVSIAFALSTHKIVYTVIVLIQVYF